MDLVEDDMAHAIAELARATAARDTCAAHLAMLQRDRQHVAAQSAGSIVTPSFAASTLQIPQHARLLPWSCSWWIEIVLPGIIAILVVLYVIIVCMFFFASLGALDGIGPRGCNGSVFLTIVNHGICILSSKSGACGHCDRVLS
jgi:hypothetical protein